MSTHPKLSGNVGRRVHLHWTLVHQFFSNAYSFELSLKGFVRLVISQVG